MGDKAQASVEVEIVSCRSTTHIVIPVVVGKLWLSRPRPVQSNWAVIQLEIEFAFPGLCPKTLSLDLVHHSSLVTAATGDLVARDVGHGPSESLFGLVIGGNEIRQRLGRDTVEHVLNETSRPIFGRTYECVSQQQNRSVATV